MRSILTPPPPAPPLPEEQIPSSYRRYRWQVFTGIFIGYAAYYLLRKNFTLAGPYLCELGFTKEELGFAMSGVAIAYGLSKFIMGTVSDRSNARNFLTIGLVVTALLTILAGVFASPAWAGEGRPFSKQSLLYVWFGIQLLIGWFGGCGWPPCGRVMTHWFSMRERGRTIAVWNVAHNVGGSLLPLIAAAGISLWGVAQEVVSSWDECGVFHLVNASDVTVDADKIVQHTMHWECGVFYLPAVLALGIAVISWLLIRDTPQSCGLPPIEYFKNDFPPDYSQKSERELTSSELVFKFVLNNPILWLVGISNAFVYLLRFGISDWAPTYLAEAKGYDFQQSAIAYFLYEFAAIPGTLVCGWLSDTVFKGRHAVTSIVFMALTIPFLLLYWLNPLDAKWLDFVSLITLGFLVYGPVMLIGVLALEIAPKKAAGTSAGFMSFWGYFIGTAFFAQYLMGFIFDHFGWNGGFVFLCFGCVLSILFLFFAAIAHKNHRNAN